MQSIKLVMRISWGPGECAMYVGSRSKSFKAITKRHVANVTMVVTLTIRCRKVTMMM